ncbi:MAG: VCBS repeat-containing protein, partial [Bacteroidales bacterium]|nr:VCBS repeat-containing protein [Bacteroidales bacterium]
MKKFILLLTALTFFAFKTGEIRSNYNIPRSAYSVTAGDIDLDGDQDIVVGHIYNFQTEWTGITTMQNDNEGEFIIDTFYFNGQHRELELAQLDSNPKPDFITQAWDNVNSQIAVIFNNSFDSSNISMIEINEYAGYISSGDINNDSYNDIVIASNDGQFWGVLYNDGTGGFSAPEYHEIEDSYPSNITCGDVDGNGRDDIVVCAQTTRVYLSYPDGFQEMILETNDFKRGASVVDFDQDGDQDILTFVGIPVVNVTSLIMYENQGNNTLDTLDEFYFQGESSRF